MGGGAKMRYIIFWRENGFVTLQLLEVSNSDSVPQLPTDHHPREPEQGGCRAAPTLKRRHPSWRLV